MFNVGEIEVLRIEESLGPGFQPNVLLPDWNAQDVAPHMPWLAPTYYDPAQDKLISSIHSWVLKTRHHTILIDTCVGNHKERPGQPRFHMLNRPYMENFAKAGLKVEDIDYVLCTHMHVDHVGWNTRLENGRWVPTFPKARYLFSKNEYTYWSEIHKKTPLDQISDSVLPIIEANRAELVGSDHALNDHIRLSPTPGHTPDHFAVCAGKGGDAAVFTGDLIHSPIQARYPELVMRVDTDRDQAVRTRRNFLERYCDTDTLCCTMHFPSPSVGLIKRWDDGFRLEYAF
jgi:glyoxylase-like metal-dependent hydrolase (beta-lactamase superfamily II)